jgi:hypothetical protein
MSTSARPSRVTRPLRPVGAGVPLERYYPVGARTIVDSPRPSHRRFLPSY